MDRDLQDVLRDLRMGTAQVGSPEQFFALVAPAAGAIRESLEAVPRATEDLRTSTNELREKAAELQRSVHELSRCIEQAEDAARVVSSSGREIVGQAARATESVRRSIDGAGDYPRWTLWLVLALASAFAFWGRREASELRRRFDILEHNQLVIAQRLGISAPAAAEPAPPVERLPAAQAGRERTDRRRLPSR